MQIIDRTDAHRPLIGAPEQIAEDIRAYQRLGVSHLVFAFRTRVLAETLETIERFATQIRPLLQ
jgi:alkanesulfonate monooxygenase SsuD/methylene tetrahydromethanopterin reductase-like flavin-dependent oxidoreductase (luciferase family)